MELKYYFLLFLFHIFPKNYPINERLISGHFVLEQLKTDLFLPYFINKLHLILFLLE
jgi:hypothetical protein